MKKFLAMTLCLMLLMGTALAQEISFESSINGIDATQSEWMINGERRALLMIAMVYDYMRKVDADSAETIQLLDTYTGAGANDIMYAAVPTSDGKVLLFAYHLGDQNASVTVLEAQGMTASEYAKKLMEENCYEYDFNERDDVVKMVGELVDD